jgi:hypothetical protein
LRDAVQTVLGGEIYHQRARELQAAIQRAGGLAKAADIVESALLTNQPVIASPENRDYPELLLASSSDSPTSSP